MPNQVHTLNALDNARVHVGDNHVTNNYGGPEKSEQDAANKYLNNLRATDPREDKIRIQQAKGRLLEASYRWALETDEFKTWRNDKECRILWVKGDPGKGKTMLLCGMVDELQAASKLSDHASGVLLSYFFCEATNAGLNSATAVLRGLIYLLAVQNPSITAQIRDRYHGSKIGGTGHWNSRITMENILSKILEDPATKGSILVIDALDECEAELDHLLTFVASHSSKVKWIISSRNRPDIEQALCSDEKKIVLSLEQNDKSVTQAIHHYIRYQTEKLAREKKCDPEVFITVRDYLYENAYGTFLWVSLICQELRRCQSWELADRVKDFPPGLEMLYWRMMRGIQDNRGFDLCKKILASVLIAHRPLHIKELARLEDLPGCEEDIPEMVKDCGSFLMIQNDTITLVHQSAKDFLLQCWKAELFPSGMETKHLTMFNTCIKAMGDLKRDIYNLNHPGTHIDETASIRTGSDTLTYLAYSCLHGFDHLQKLEETTKATVFKKGGTLHKFLCQKSLFWIEALVHLRSLSKGISVLTTLEASLLSFDEDDPVEVNVELVRDTKQFILCFRAGIEEYPLQIYASGLLFSPQKSLVRHYFASEMIKGITGNPKLNENWNIRLKTLECESRMSWLRFSPTGDKLAAFFAFSNAYWLRMWQVNDGATQIIRLPGNPQDCVALSTDWRWCAVVSHHAGVTVWQVDTLDSALLCYEWGKPKSDTDSIIAASFSPDGKSLAVLYERELCIWEVETGIEWCIPLGHPSFKDPYGMAFSSDSQLLAIFSWEVVTVFDVCSREETGTRDISEIAPINPTFIPKTHRLFIGQALGFFIWDLDKEARDVWIMNPVHKKPGILSLPDGHWAPENARMYETETFWGPKAYLSLQKFELEDCFGRFPRAISPDGQWLAGTDRGVVWLWHAIEESVDMPPLHGNDQEEKRSTVNIFIEWLGKRLSKLFPRGHDHVGALHTFPNSYGRRDVTICELCRSENGMMLASQIFTTRLEIGELKIWDIQTSKPVASLAEATTEVGHFSPDGQLLVAQLQERNAVGIFDGATGVLRHKIPIDFRVHLTAVSQACGQTGQYMVAVGCETDLFVFCAKTGALQAKINYEHLCGRLVTVVSGISAAFSPIKNSVAVAAIVDNKLHLNIWNTATGAIQRLTGKQGKTAWNQSAHGISFSPSGKWLATLSTLYLSNSLNEICLWDAKSGHLCGRYLAKTDRIQFVNELSIQTDKGIFETNPNEASGRVREHDQAHEVRTFVEAGVSNDGSWITWDGQILLWLPNEHRPKESCAQSVHKNMVTIGCESGSVFSIRFDQSLLQT